MTTRSAVEPTTPPPDAEAELLRLRTLLAHVADAVDLALDADWREAIDILCDLSDELHAELVP